MSGVVLPPAETDDTVYRLRNDAMGPDEYFLSWIDTEMKTETLEARKSGKTFPPVIEVYDQYRTE